MSRTDRRSFPSQFELRKQFGGGIHSMTGNCWRQKYTFYLTADAESVD